MSKPKVLILYNNIFDYRVPIFNILATKYDLTVAFTDGEVPNVEQQFQVIHFPSKNIGPFVYINRNISKLCDSFDAVISIGEVFRINYAYQALRFWRKFKLAFWSIGVSASYTKRYDEVHKWDWLRDFFYKKADACIFYSDYPIKKNLKRGYKRERMFVANNTVEVLPCLSGIVKDSILFIGSLYKQKGIDVLLEAYIKAYTNNADIPSLNIIGGGSEYEQIKQWIDEKGLSHKITLTGPIYDKKVKRTYFQRSYACISPQQAGLSVLESEGYGVPFITMNNAYTGGERFNIHDGVNGILMRQKDELVNIILDIAQCPKKYIQMGQNAYQYYHSERTPEKMAKGIEDAINYMLNE